jgi:hypothetical protein
MYLAHEKDSIDYRDVRHFPKMSRKYSARSLLYFGHIAHTDLSYFGRVNMRIGAISTGDGKFEKGRAGCEDAGWNANVFMQQM